MGLVRLPELISHTNHEAREVRLNRTEPGAVVPLLSTTGLVRQIPTISQELQV